MPYRCRCFTVTNRCLIMTNRCLIVTKRLGDDAPLLDCDTSVTMDSRTGAQVNGIYGVGDSLPYIATSQEQTQTVSNTVPRTYHNTNPRPNFEYLTLLG